MKIIKNGTLTNYGRIINCLKCKSQEGYVLQAFSHLDIYYCLPCIQKAFLEVKNEPRNL